MMFYEESIVEPDPL